MQRKYLNNIKSLDMRSILTKLGVILVELIDYLGKLPSGPVKKNLNSQPVNAQQIAVIGT